jgi:hypothetical protein
MSVSMLYYLLLLLPIGAALVLWKLPSWFPYSSLYLTLFSIGLVYALLAIGLFNVNGYWFYSSLLSFFSS